MKRYSIYTKIDVYGSILSDKGEEITTVSLLEEAMEMLQLLKDRHPTIYDNHKLSYFDVTRDKWIPSIVGKTRQVNVRIPSLLMGPLRDGSKSKKLIDMVVDFEIGQIVKVRSHPKTQLIAFYLPEMVIDKLKLIGDGSISNGVMSVLSHQLMTFRKTVDLDPKHVGSLILGYSILNLPDMLTIDDDLSLTACDLRRPDGSPPCVVMMGGNSISLESCTGLYNMSVIK